MNATVALLVTPFIAIALAACSDDGSGEAYAKCMDRISGGSPTEFEVETCLKVAEAASGLHELNELYEDRIRLLRRQCGRGDGAMYDQGKVAILAKGDVVTDYVFEVQLDCSTGDVLDL